MLYIQSFEASSFKRSIFLMHIPKTAGTALERFAGSIGVAWGKCWVSPRQRTGCPPLSDNLALPFATATPAWHIPSYYFPLQGYNPYQATELFVVARHPYQRLLSEYYYVCREFPSQCNKPEGSGSLDPNDYLDGRLDLGSDDTFVDAGHYVPQYDYVIGPHDVRHVDHVLHFDKLEENLSRLFAAYGLDWKEWPKNNVNGGNYSSDFEWRPDVFNRLQSTYTKDWLLLGGTSPV